MSSPMKPAEFEAGQALALALLQAFKVDPARVVRLVLEFTWHDIPTLSVERYVNADCSSTAVAELLTVVQRYRLVADSPEAEASHAA